MRAALGAALVVAHALGFGALIERCRGTELEVELVAPAASQVLALDGRVPDALRDRVEVDLDGTLPGLVRRTWTVRYQGGHARAVGAAQLVGPFQDPAAPACTGRLVLGQRMLDDGDPASSTIARLVGAELERALSGQGAIGIGDYRRVEGLALHWAERSRHPEDVFLAGPPTSSGYLRATARVVFDRIDVPVVVILRPEVVGGELVFRAAVRAEVDVGNRVLQWISDRLGASSYATGLARRELDAALDNLVRRPPPLELPDGSRLEVAFCSGPLEIAERAYGAVAFSVSIRRPGGTARDLLPPRRGLALRATPSPSTTLAMDLDLDALNAALFELWRSGFLGKQLDALALDRRFNDDPVVAELLTIRISPLRLALPPVLSPAPHGLRLSAEARLDVTDGARTTPARAWGGLAFVFGRRVDEQVSVELSALALTCERAPSTLVPCYADLVAAMRERGPGFHAELTRAFTQLLERIFVNRQLADLVIRRASPRVILTPGTGNAAATNASLHLELDTALAPRP